MKAKSFHINRCVTAYALLFNTCRAERNNHNHVKKAALFELKASLQFLVIIIVKRRWSVATDPEAVKNVCLHTFQQGKSMSIVN